MPYSTENNFVNYCARCSINCATEIPPRASTDNNSQPFGIYRNSLKMPTPEQISNEPLGINSFPSLFSPRFLSPHEASSYILMRSHTLGSFRVFRT